MRESLALSPHVKLSSAAPVFECYLSLKPGFKARVRGFSHLNIFSQIQLICILHGHKNLSWLSGVERRDAHFRFKEELFNVAGVDINAVGASDDQLG